VALLSQKTINSKIRSVFEKLGNTIVHPILLVQELNISFKKSRLFFQINYDPETEINIIETTGYFAPDYKDYSVIILLNINPETKRVELKELLLVDISITIQHEFVHKRQYIKRGRRFFDSKEFKPIINDKQELKEYFELPDEIDAYAKNIVLDLSQRFPELDTEGLFKFLSFSSIWMLYGITSNKTKKKLLRKVYKLHKQGVQWDT
jgi:hypothetical protein